MMRQVHAYSHLGDVNGRFQVLVKGTVRVILSDPSCKDGNAQFTTITLKALSNQV